MKQVGFILFILSIAFLSKAQPAECILKPPEVTIDFGAGDTRDLNSGYLPEYRRVFSSCPTDGHYSLAPYTSRCFSDDWHTITGDHTGGGNMLLVNAAPQEGTFLRIPIPRLKSNTIYEIGLWLMNLCRPTDKCPYPLLPRLNIRVETSEGRLVANIVTGDVPRIESPKWSQHAAFFTTPASTAELILVMSDNAPGGCGNDFAMDDITFSECVKVPPKVVVTPKKPTPKTPVVTKRPVTNAKKEEARVIKPATKDVLSTTGIKLKSDSIARVIPKKIIPPAPLVLRTRENALVRKIETEAGEIKIDIYDNGEIDGDTVSIYHNNSLVKSHMRLSQKPISLSISVDPTQPHHELVMVAENLGSIPPNTSVMTVTTSGKRYEVFISSSEQKNAMVVFDLKK